LWSAAATDAFDLSSTQAAIPMQLPPERNRKNNCSIPMLKPRMGKAQIKDSNTFGRQFAGYLA
jgi:hypothetical protein